MKLDDELAAIKARVEAATPGYSIGRIEERDNYCINVPCPPSDSGLRKWPLCEFYGGAVDPKHDVTFILHAPTDLFRLLAALELCRRQRNSMHECIVTAGERGYAFDDSGIRGALDAALLEILRGNE